MTDSAEPLLVRARMMCEDGLFAKAHELVDKALNIDPQNADAYIVSLMAHHQAMNEEELGAIPTDRITAHPDYEKAIRFGDEELRRRMEAYAARASKWAAFEESTHLLRAFGIARDRPLSKSRQLDLKRLMEKKLRDDEATAKADAVKARAEDLKTRVGKILKEDSHPDGVQWEIIDVHPGEDRVLVLAYSLISQRSWRGSTWQDSELRAWLNSDFLESLPQGFRARIVAVEHRTRGETDAVVDSVFVPSEAELGRSRHKGAQYIGGKTPGWDSSKGQWWVRGSSFTMEGRVPAMEANGRPVFTWGRERQDDFEKIYGVHAGSPRGVRPAFWLGVGDPNPVASRHESPLVAGARRLCEKGEFRKEKSERNAASRLSTDVAEGIAAVALALDPNDAGPHVVALMANYLCPTEADLGLLATAQMSNESHYLCAVRQGDADLRKRLETYAVTARKRASSVASMEKLVHDTAATAEAEKGLSEHRTQMRVLATRCDEFSKAQAELEQQIQEVVERREALSPFALRRRYGAASERDRLTGEHLSVCRELKTMEHKLSAYERQLTEMNDKWQLHLLVDSFQVRELDDGAGRALLVATKPAASMPYDDDAGNVWEKCTLRAWLNTDFRRNLPDRIRLRLRSVVHEDGVIDDVFILSKTEAVTRSSIDGAPAAALYSAGWARSTSTDESAGTFRLDARGKSWPYTPGPTASVYPAMWMSFGSES